MLGLEQKRDMQSCLCVNSPFAPARAQILFRLTPLLRGWNHGLVQRNPHA